MYYRNLCALTAACLLASGAAPSRAGAGQPRSSDTSELLLDGQPVVVTSSKTSQRLDDSPASVTVITEREIAASAARTLPDLLRTVPGVDVMAPNQSQENVSIRGFNTRYADKLLVMVDGRSVYQDAFGGVFWNMTPILLSRIKRIEVARGPGSALYGANAFNGVINIITKTPEELAGGPARYDVRVAGGEHGMQSHESAVNQALGHGWDLAFGAAYDRTSGFGERAPGIVRDSYTAPTITADLQKRTGNGYWLLSAGSTDATADLAAGFTMTDSDWRSRFASLLYRQDRGRNPLTIRASGNFISSYTGNPAGGDSRSLTFEAQQERPLGPRHRLVYGGSVRDIAAQIRVAGPDRHHELVLNAFVQDEIRLSSTTLAYVGARVDDNTKFGSNYSPRLSLVHQLGGNRVLRASYGTAFRAPAIIDSYYSMTMPVAPGITTSYVADPHLRPEELEGVELGYRHSYRDGYIELTAFHNEIAGYVDWVPTAFLPNTTIPVSMIRTNARNARATGAELDMRFPISKGLQGLLNYAFLDARDDRGAAIDFSPRHKVNVGLLLDRQGGMYGSCIAHFVDSSNGSIAEAPMATVPSYVRVDGKIGIRLPGRLRGWSASVSGTNLLNDGHREFPATATNPPELQSAAQSRTLWLSLEGRL